MGKASMASGSPAGDDSPPEAEAALGTGAGASSATSAGAAGAVSGLGGLGRAAWAVLRSGTLVFFFVALL